MPRLRTKRVHSRTIGARVPPEDYETFKKMVEQRGLNMGEVVRTLWLNFVRGGSEESRLLRYQTALLESVIRDSLLGALTVERLDYIRAELRSQIPGLPGVPKV